LLTNKNRWNTEIPQLSENLRQPKAV